MDEQIFLIEQEDRYSRHSLIPWWDQQILSSSKILVAGVGAIGNEVLKNLALMGFGHLTLIDFDQVSLSNLSRSVLFQEQDQGQSKVQAARRSLLAINPALQINAIEGNLQFDLGLGAIADHDLIIGCLDSVNSRWMLNQLAYHSNIPWINTGIGVSQGEISWFDPRGRESACYECTISSSMWAKREQRFSCQGFARQLPPETVPTTAPLASLVGAIAVEQALLYLHQDDRLLQPGEKIFVSLQPWHSFKVKIKTSSPCPNHESPAITRVPLDYDGDRLLSSYLTQLHQLGYEDISIKLRNAIVTTLRCIQSPCSRGVEQVYQPVNLYPETKLPCPRCGQIRDFEIMERINGQTLTHQPDLQLKHLCLPPQDILEATSNQGLLHLVFS